MTVRRVALQHGYGTSYAEAASIRIAERTFARRTEEVTAQHGLTPQRYLLLLLVRVAGDDGSPATVTSLVGQLLTTQSSVTQLVRGAEVAGLVRRQRDTRDARRQHLFLTPEGARRLEGAFHALAADRADLVEALSGHDRAWAQPPRSPSPSRGAARSA